MNFFEGYVWNYRRMNLSKLHNRSMFTRREIDYFANLGEMLGFDSFIEDSKFDKSNEAFKTNEFVMLEVGCQN